MKYRVLICQQDGEEVQVVDQIETERFLVIGDGSTCITSGESPTYFLDKLMDELKALGDKKEDLKNKIQGMPKDDH